MLELISWGVNVSGYVWSHFSSSDSLYYIQASKLVLDPVGLHVKANMNSGRESLLLGVFHALSIFGLRNYSDI